MLKRILFIGVAFFFLVSCFQKKQNVQNEKDTNMFDFYLLIGSYASDEDKGIYVYRFNSDNGSSEYVSAIRNITNPSYLTVSSDGKTIYSVSETGKEACACSFSFDEQTGILSSLNSELTAGEDPCYINSNGRFVLTANYSGGNISVFPISEDNTLLPLSQKIDFTNDSHLHCVLFSPDNKFLFATDLGTDQLYRFPVNESLQGGIFLKEKEMVRFDLEKGSGPRHLTFHPNNKYLYCINELAGTVTVFKYNDGDLNPIQYIASDTTSGDHKKGSADIHLSPDGKFLYSSNRLKEDGLAIFSVNELNGKLTFIGYQSTGIHPRNFIITPNGKFLLVANRDSNSIEIFERDETTGLLRNIEKNILADKPVCLKFISINEK